MTSRSNATCAASSTLMPLIGEALSPLINKFGLIMVETENFSPTVDCECAADLAWPLAPAAFSLAPVEVHLWSTNLDLPASNLQKFASILSPAESERAAHFRFECHRSRYVAGRGW